MRKRDVWVKVRVSEEERDLWQAMAKEQELTLADLIRQAVGGVKTVDREPKRTRASRTADPELLNALSRIGSNLNQIARWANTHKSAASAMEVIAAMAAIEKLMLLHTTPRAEKVMKVIAEVPYAG